MDFSAWTLYFFLGAAAVLAVALHYRAREPGGRGRGLLIGLRGLAVAVLLLLLFNPDLPVQSGGTGGAAVLLDASLSMRLPDGEGETRWSRAVDAAEAARAGTAEGVFLFGGEPRVRHDLSELEPDAVSTLLEPAVRAALESGATRLQVLTDGGLEDGQQAISLAQRFGAAVEVHVVGGEAGINAGVAELDVPSWLEAGEEAVARVAVAALGPVRDSLTVVLRVEDSELARATVQAVGAGRLSSIDLPFTAPAAGEEPVRMEVALEGTDVEPEDDRRFAYVRVTDDPAGMVLLSLRPDQEPRFLLPVLERALGVPARGWLMLPRERYVRLGSGGDAGMTSTVPAVREAVEGADLVVLHGYDGSAPDWVRNVAASAGRVLVLPGPGTLEGVPLRLDAPASGDWYPSSVIPASPVAPFLAGVEPGDSPPLEAVRGAEAPTGFWAPLNATLGRSGTSQPVLLAGTTEGRRLAVALGEGYWRWAFSGGAGRILYDRLWSAVGGWLMEETAVAVGRRVEPEVRVVARGTQVRFRVLHTADSLAVRVVAEGGDLAADTALAVVDGAAVLGVLPPGHYRYEAAASGDEVANGEGAFTVSWYSPEFTRPAADALPDVDAGEATGGAAGGAVGGARPLRSAGWPYVLLVGLLCVEWVLRRRWGLR